MSYVFPKRNADAGVKVSTFANPVLFKLNLKSHLSSKELASIAELFGLFPREMSVHEEGIDAVKKQLGSAFRHFDRVEAPAAEEIAP